MVSRSTPGPYLSQKNVGSANEIEIFVSSGSDLLKERDHVCELVQTLDEQMHFALRARLERVHLRATRWELDAPQRAYGYPNAHFEDMASSAALTIVLLHNDLRPGTRREITAALAKRDVQIAALWFQPDDPEAAQTIRLRKFLDGKKKTLLWEATGPPGSRQADLAMLKIVARTAFDAFRSKLTGEVDQEPYHDEY